MKWFRTALTGILCILFTVCILPVSAAEPVKLEDPVWYYDHQSYTLYYGFSLKNEMKNKAERNVGYRVKAVDEAGNEVASVNGTIKRIEKNGDRVYYAAQISCTGQPAQVKIRTDGAKPVSSANRKKTKQMYPVHNVKETVDTQYALVSGFNNIIVTGTIENKTDQALQDARIVAVFKKDGKIVDMIYDKVESVDAHSTLDITLTQYRSVAEHDSVKCYITQ
ncbi:hypothetical protein [Catenisphaera adipataccumulans]|uniref:Uncharacterized protein n=1 Tax=Catenisphaera adipataccumulans TaxID=700500 RepID=A0A7W8CZ86_9FIRM|nr:hypothetical protein [Catenisphaera adipataccumulans]MBB5183138.1 hypothetical protein [Catenisphaera adipataccumulans]